MGLARDWKGKDLSNPAPTPFQPNSTPVQTIPKTPPMHLVTLTMPFIPEYDFYLWSVRKYANNSAVKYLKNFGKIIRICLSSGWLPIDALMNYKNKVKKVDQVILTPEEI